MAERPDSGPVKIWCLLREQKPHVAPVEAAMGSDAQFLYDERWDPRTIEKRLPDVLLCVNDWPDEVARCLDTASRNRIPSLVVQDGILEWRCQYENPLFGSGGGAPQHQPVLADKIACIGRQSARQIAAWGNAAKVEVTGMPRLDHLLDRRVEPIRKPGNRLLVMTAKNPGFTPQQLDVSLRSLRNLRDALATRQDLDIRWRVSRNVAEALGVVSDFQNVSSEELADSVERSDAVITTPSTAMLEAMLLERPVAALDYHNVPRFVPTAWTISAPEHIAPVLGELCSPQARKMGYQRDTLNDCLEIDGPASPRLAELLRRMAEEGARARREDRRLAFPPDLLGRAGGFPPGEPPPLHLLYPEAAAFVDTEVRSLQARVARLHKANEQLREELSRRHLADVLRRAGKVAVANLTPRRKGRS